MPQVNELSWFPVFSLVLIFMVLSLVKVFYFIRKHSYCKIFLTPFNLPILL